MTAVPAARRHGSDFAELSRSIKQAGLLHRRRGYYLATNTLTIAAFAGVWVMFGFLGDSWWQLGTAALLAVVCTQLSFLGHDAGHKQIFRRRRANDAVGYVHAGLVGLSYGWWVGKHNRHHANPNHEDDDPDLDIPALAFTTGQGRIKAGFLRWMAKYQAFLFFPLLLLEGFNLHWSSIQAAWRGQVKLRVLESAMLTAHTGGYLAAVFVVLSPVTAIVFVLLHQGLWGVYMGCSFAPNHKGMPTTTNRHEWDFLRKQVLTSRNIRGGRWVDFLLGGLNYQIEHHLFPSMPRPNLRRAQTIVRRFCATHEIGYSQCGLFRSYGHVLRHLHAVGAPLRTTSGTARSHTHTR
ncbi:delta fatty acid desaturase [Prauserella marina]|uniref:Fatty acid desaturase n=1 Tax=Prauserella marina TaxID=530584 RepID=A0A222VSD5_9PSEU|nr:acyl-CoA desaturase [Prauserella marina]ASR36643.1 delta fatty acid desaturase [Prauserella marina]PWV74060.1 fatty acid desaturase [Prauserella marina]SDD61982.1 Fatty acid desaturase [Prauserella marina]